MPFRKGQMELHALRPANRDSETSGLAVELIRLIFGLEHELAHVWDGGSLLSFQASAVGLQDR